MTTNATKRIFAVVVLLLLTAVGVVFLSAFIRAHPTRSSNACINNLRQIDAAKQQWALDTNKTTNDTPSWDAIRVYVGRGPEGEILKLSTRWYMHIGTSW